MTETNRIEYKRELTSELDIGRRLWRCFTKPLLLVTCICKHLPTCLFVVFLNYQREATIKQTNDLLKREDEDER